MNGQARGGSCARGRHLLGRRRRKGETTRTRPSGKACGALSLSLCVALDFVAQTSCLLSLRTLPPLPGHTSPAYITPAGASARWPPARPCPGCDACLGSWRKTPCGGRWALCSGPWGRPGSCPRRGRCRRSCGPSSQGIRRRAARDFLGCINRNAEKIKIRKNTMVSVFCLDLPVSVALSIFLIARSLSHLIANYRMKHARGGAGRDQTLSSGRPPSLSQLKVLLID